MDQKEKTYTIYSKEGCRYCKLAKEFMDSKGLLFKEIHLDPTAEEYQTIRDNLISQTGHRTFPWIFEGDRFVGGYKELVGYHTLEDF